MTVPLVIVTGFLGAGKTTLINRLLARREARTPGGAGPGAPREGGGAGPGAPRGGGKLGVIVNELGEVGIDGALLGGEAPRQVELPGGCVCCVLGDQLDATLLDLVAQNPGLEAIVLETTGVAEPLPIAWAVAREPVARQVRLAAVVTLIDATSFIASRPVSASVDAQVAYADVLLVTKSELATRISDVERAESVACTLAPRALIRRGSADEHAAWLEALLTDPPLPDGRAAAPLAGQVPQPDGQVGHVGQVGGHVHGDDCRHLDSQAAHGIDSVWLAVEHPVDVEELEDQLAELPPNYVRIKGIVRTEVASATRWVAVHRVGPRVSSEPVEPGEPQQARIVALGPGVAVADLARCVAASAL